MEVIRSATVHTKSARVPNSKESNPHWAPLLLQPSSSSLLDSAFLLYTHLGHLYMCVQAHLVLLKKQKQKKTRWTKGIETLMVTRPLVFDCITDWLCFFVFSCFCLFILNYESCFYGCHFLQFFNGVHYFLSLLCCKLQDHYGTDKVFFSLPLHFNHASFFLFFFFPFVHLVQRWRICCSVNVPRHECQKQFPSLSCTFS